ncbi:cytochrome c oxidase subunit Vb, partial [Trifolium medium]|nr:cytochrome c oxidase subunit Vb [Trifolium medium]
MIMWRRLFSSPHIKTLAHSHFHPPSAVAGLRSLDITSHFATQSDGSIDKIVENGDVDSDNVTTQP